MSVAKDTYDVLVLSGGGAKGAYGAGAAKALAMYRQRRGTHNPICFLGASAGALNAAILASYPPDQFNKAADDLLTFWREATNWKILGTWISWQKFQFAKAGVFSKIPLAGRSPFYIYSNSALRKLIEAKTTGLKSAISAAGESEHHLVVAVTDYTEGTLKAFFHSHLFQKCVDFDRLFNDPNTTPDARYSSRLLHCHPIAAETLVDVLLASAAIPVFFPPVKIGDNVYIDGGVGNNTPTREAAYFFRYIKECKLADVGRAYSVVLDEPRTRKDQAGKEGLFGIILRALDIYHYVHMKPIIKGWSRINREVDEHRERLTELVRWARDDQKWSPSVVDALDHKIKEKKGLWELGGASERVSAPMYVVEPSAPLGDTLTFAAKVIENNIQMGYIDMLRQLYPPNVKGDRGTDYEQLAEAKY